MKSLLFLSFICLLIAIISGKAVENSDSEVEVQLDSNNDVQEDSQVESQLVRKAFNYNKQRDLDVYYDEALVDEKRPVIFHVHGGGWAEGSKEDEIYIGEFLQNNNFVVVAINYRLYPETENIDDMVEDVYNALQWTIKNIYKYGGDEKQITLMGHSAGAHLITLTTVKATLKMKVNGIQLKPYHVKHLISINGPHEFNNTYEEYLASAEQMREISKLAPELAFLANYAGAQEHCFAGKTGYDQVKILKEYKDKSIKFLGSEKFTFIECENDTTVVLGSADPMIEQINRTVKQVKIDHKIYPGDHMGVLDRIKDADPEMIKEVLSIINSVY